MKRSRDGTVLAALLGCSWLALALMADHDRGMTTRPVSAQPAPGWTLAALSPSDRGTVGARWLAQSADGDTVAFPHDGDIITAGGPGNPDGNTEIFAWRPAGVEQLTATSGGPQQSQPSVSADGSRVAAISNADLAGPGTGGSNNVFLWEGGAWIRVSDGPAGTAAESPALSADGTAVAYWHTADLTGGNPGGGLQLFLTRLGPPAITHQLTGLSGNPYHDAPSISADGSHVAFIVDADLTGDNADGSWEVFLWEGPPRQPGDAASFEQITDWRPPLTGREIYGASVSADGSAVAFTARGQVDVRLPGGHTTLEVYQWRAPAELTRLTTATAPNASSFGARLAGDGRHIAFVSLSDFDAGGPGNDDRNQELFVWSACHGFEQVTSSAGRPLVVANVPELRPAVDGSGAAAAFVSERDDDIGPLALPSRRGIAFRAVDDDPVPCDVPPTVTPTTPPGPTATASPGATATSTAPPAPTPTVGAGGQVCPQVAARIPVAVQARALANPDEFYGWNIPANPGLAPGPRNPPRRWLSIRDPGKPFSPVNPAVWKVGCP